MNGRVNLSSTRSLSQPPVDKITSYDTALSGQFENTLLSKMFFSKENIQIIQNSIRAGVYSKTNNQHIIGEQSVDALKIIMRSFFLEKSLNLNENIKSQIEKLNNMTIDYCVKEVYGELTSYMKYINDITYLPTPNDRPIFGINNKKELKNKDFIS